MSLGDLAPLTDDNSALFRNSPVKRIKRARFVRNVCVALGNVGTPADLAILDQLADDSDPLIAEHASWAAEQNQEPRSFAGSEDPGRNSTLQSFIPYLPPVPPLLDSWDSWYFLPLRFVLIGLIIPLHESRRGGIGRRAGLKIQFTQVSVGSIPSVGTPKFLHRGFAIASHR